MALAACVRALLLPGVWSPEPGRRGVRLRGATLGRATRRATTGGGAGAPRAMSHRVLAEAGPLAGVAVLKFKNPPVNSLSLGMLMELVISLEKLENNKAIRGIVITSERPGIFATSLDLMEMCGQNPAHYAEYWKAVQELWLRLYQSNKGAYPTGECLIPLTCDYRVMADNPKYTIGLKETLVGIVAPFWFKDTLVNTFRHRSAECTLQLGMLFLPTEALQVGIVDQVVPKEQVQSTALSVMAQWMAIPDHAQQLTKSMMWKLTVDHLVKQRC